MRVCLQAGHQSIQSNCWPAMRGGTGAPGEILWTPMIRSKVAALLRYRGIEVIEVDGNVNCSGPFGPFDLFLAIHYQSNNPSASGFGVFTPDPSVDNSHARSVELASKLCTVYGQLTGLVDQSPAWDNVNTQLYYVWQVMNGPLALIECGVGAPGAPDHDLLWNQSDLIAAAIAEGICSGLGVTFSAATGILETLAPRRATAKVATKDTINLFGRGMDNALWHMRWASDSGWSAWHSLGGQLTTPDVAATQRGDQIDVFVIGADGGTFHIWSTNEGATWSNFVAHGGKLSGSLTVISSEPDRLDADILAAIKALPQPAASSAPDLSGVVQAATAAKDAAIAAQQASEGAATAVTVMKADVALIKDRVIKDLA